MPSRPSRLPPFLLLGGLLAASLALAAWKESSQDAAAAAAASLPEPAEAVTVATGRPREHVRTTSAIGTVLALRSVTLRNELAGTVARVDLSPGALVEAGAVLVALDVDVEQAELAAQQAQVDLARTVLGRIERASQGGGASEVDVDRARADLDIALAEVARTRAIIARKTVRAPFRARVGLSDVHPGQYLDEGTELTTLQGVDADVHVDFAVAQEVAATLSTGDRVTVHPGSGAPAVQAPVVAVDARVDVTTRNAWVRVRLSAEVAPAPGASVRVDVPVGAARTGVAVPVSALRRGPAGDHVFVVEAAADGALRARLQPVVTAAVLGDEVLLEAGLEVGERVAASGSFKLRDGALVVEVGGDADGTGGAAGGSEAVAAGGAP